MNMRRSTFLCRCATVEYMCSRYISKQPRRHTRTVSDFLRLWPFRPPETARASAKCDRSLSLQSVASESDSQTFAPPSGSSKSRTMSPAALPLGTVSENHVLSMLAVNLSPDPHPEGTRTHTLRRKPTDSNVLASDEREKEARACCPNVAHVSLAISWISPIACFMSFADAVSSISISLRRVLFDVRRTGTRRWDVSLPLRRGPEDDLLAILRWSRALSDFSMRDIAIFSRRRGRDGTFSSTPRASFMNFPVQAAR